MSPARTEYDRLRREAARIRARLAPVPGVEWRPRPASCDAPQQQQPQHDEAAAPLQWCARLWGSDVQPTPLQCDVVDYLLHGDAPPCEDAEPPSLHPRLLPIVREVVVPELPVPTDDGERAALVAQLVTTILEEAERSAGQGHQWGGAVIGRHGNPMAEDTGVVPRRPWTDRPCMWLPRRTAAEGPAASGMTGTRVAPIDDLARMDRGVVSARLHGLARPCGRYVVPAGGAPPRELQVADVRDDVSRPIRR